MLATEADLVILAGSPEMGETSVSDANDALAEMDDELAPARGIAHGLAWGVVSLAAVGTGLWLML